MTTKAVVLARGKGTRMRAADPSAALTAEQRRAADSGIKAMMPIAGRPFLDYILSGLADAGIDEVGLVVAPEHDLLRTYYAGAAPLSRLAVSFLVQSEARGTADAVLAAETWAGRAGFLVMNGDNLYPVEALRNLASLDEPGLPVFERADLVRSGNVRQERIRAFALVDVGPDGYLRGIVEKPTAETMERGGDRALVSMNCWSFDHRIFEACRDVPLSARGEFELPEAVGLALARGVTFKAILARGPVLDLSTRADAADLERRVPREVRL
jgi:glucose-1-phosphate thymidylyltransferase